MKKYDEDGNACFSCIGHTHKREKGHSHCAMWKKEIKIKQCAFGKAYAHKEELNEMLSMYGESIGTEYRKKTTLFGEGNGYIHLMSDLNPKFTICGYVYDICSGGEEESIRKITSTNKKIVTCPKCIAEINNCRGVKTRNID